MPWRLGRVTQSDRDVLAGSSLLVIGRLTSKFAVVIFLIVAARLLTKAQYGVYSYVLVLASTFAVLADPQVSIIAGREVAAARRSPGAAYWTALPITAATGALASVAMLLFGLLDFGPGVTMPMLVAAGGYVIFNRLFSLGLEMLRAVGRFASEVAIETGGTVLLVAVASAVAAGGGGVTALLAVFMAHSLIFALICHWVLRVDVRDRATIPGYRMELLMSGIKLATAAGATAIATRGPLLVLGVAGTAVAVAGYSAALRFADATYLLALTAGQALLPSIASILSTDAPRAARLTRRAIALATVAGAVLAAAVAPFGSDITTTVFGSQYSGSGSLVSVMMVGVPFMGMFWIAWFALCAHRREREIMLVALGCAAAALTIAIVVVPMEGATGAAWVYVGALAALGLTTYGAFERHVSVARRSS